MPFAYVAFRLALLLVPASHPYRIFATERARFQWNLSRRAAVPNNKGRQLPLMANLLCSYLLLDLTSVRIHGPFDLLPVDDEVRVFDRIEWLAGEGAQLVAGLVSLAF